MKDGPPLMLFAGIFVIVGASAAVPAALYMQASGEPRVAVAGDAEAGAMAIVRAEPSPIAATPIVPVLPVVPTVVASAAPTASAKVATAEPDGPGFLTISTTPHARVSERGRILCTSTPCARLPLAPGARTITLENKEESLKTIITVTITSGETISRRVTLKP